MCREAYAWFDNNPSVLQIHQEDEYLEYLAGNGSITNPMDLLAFKNKVYDSFDDFKENFDRVYMIKFCNDKEHKRWLKESTCTCRNFQKSFICKHIIGFAFYNKLKKCPQEGNNKSISKKPKKGRVA